MRYLDRAAMTKPHEEVIDSMHLYLEDRYCNPSAVYATASDRFSRKPRHERR